ncbi:MAG: shikimate kinase [Myxococcota bacterium]|nr:shikimate kinase [Myxococcota bacterium]
MSDLSRQVGARLRARRIQLKQTIRQLADLSGVSARYITSAEHGQANLSLQKLEHLCHALEMPVARLVSAGARGEIDELLGRLSDEALVEVVRWIKQRHGLTRKPFVALLGVRGAGKSSVGRQLAERLGMPLWELDERIERQADLSLAEIFSLHGEPYYRRLEFDALNALVSEHRQGVIATGGGIVTNSQNFERLKDVSVTIWLKARAEDHWDRVIQQGDRRPMRNHPQAMAELRTLLAQRDSLYGQANFVVDTSAHPLSDVVDKIVSFLADVAHVG